MTGIIPTLVTVSGLCIVQKLSAVKMAIHTESSQKAVAIDAGIDESQLARKLNNHAPFTFENFDRLPEEVQRVALLEMLSQMGLPERAKRWLSVVRELDAHKQRSA